MVPNPPLVTNSLSAKYCSQTSDLVRMNRLHIGYILGGEDTPQCFNGWTRVDLIGASGFEEALKGARMNLFS